MECPGAEKNREGPGSSPAVRRNNAIKSHSVSHGRRATFQVPVLKDVRANLWNFPNGVKSFFAGPMPILTFADGSYNLSRYTGEGRTMAEEKR